MATVGLTGYTGSFAIGDVGGGAAGANLIRLPRVEQWGIGISDELYEYVCSDSNKAATRLSGARDWTGSIKGVDAWPRNTSSGAPYLIPGQTFQARGIYQVRSGATNDRIFYGDAFVDEISVDVDYESNAPFMYTVSFSGIGAPSGIQNQEATGTPTPLVDPPRASDAVGYGLKLAPVESSVTDVKYEILKAKLTAKANKTQFISSETAPYRGRAKGSFDLSLSAQVVFDDPTVLPAIGTVYRAKLFVSSTAYFLCEFMRLKEITGIDVAMKGDAVISAGLQFELTTVATVTGTPTFGQFELPGANEVWPTGY